MGIEQYLQQGEQILYASDAHPEKTDKQYDRVIMIFSFICILFLLVLFGNVGLILKVFFIIVFLFFAILIIYAFVKSVKKNKENKNDQYFITNFCVLAVKNNRFIFCTNINSITCATVAHEKNNFGDLSFAFGFNPNQFDRQFNNTTTYNNKAGQASQLKDLAGYMLPYGGKKMKHIDFIGIENPRGVLEFVKRTNPNIMVTDDRPKVNTNIFKS